jgi:uncharacterized protein YndB with AHSA1/START domain
MVTDSIEKKVFLRASRERVWRALADSSEFGRWFGVRFNAQFTPGASMRGVVVPTTVDAEAARSQREYEGAPFMITVETMDPGRLFSFRWHPFAAEPGVDYSDEPTTLVEFEIEEREGGTALTIRESGFDRIPLARRAKAFSANEGGWSWQIRLIEKYVTSVA